MLSFFSIPNRAALDLAKGMDIREIRRKNLLLLREEMGSVRAIADKVDTDPNYISQLLGGKGKSFMGYSMARRLEKACLKDVGWMDQSHDEAEDVDDDIKDISALARGMNRAQRKNLKSLIKSILGATEANNDEHQDTSRRIA